MNWFFILFVSFFVSYSFGQNNKDRWFETQGVAVVSAFQNEDVFAGVGGYFMPNEKWLFHGDLLLGVRRTFFQKADFWWITLGGQRDFIPNEKLFFGPSMQLGTGFLDLDNDINLHNYYDVRLGYFLSFGNRIKVFQSSYYGIRQLNLNNNSKGHFFPGYSLQFGMQYDI